MAVSNGFRPGVLVGWNGLLNFGKIDEPLNRGGQVASESLGKFETEGGRERIGVCKGEVRFGPFKALCGLTVFVEIRAGVCRPRNADVCAIASTEPIASAHNNNPHPQTRRILSPFSSIVSLKALSAKGGRITPPDDLSITVRTSRGGAEYAERGRENVPLLCALRASA